MFSLSRIPPIAHTTAEVSTLPAGPSSQAAPSHPSTTAPPPFPASIRRHQRQLELVWQLQQQQAQLQPYEAARLRSISDDVQPVAIGDEMLHLLVHRSGDDSCPYAVLGNGYELPLVWQAQYSYYVPAEVTPAPKDKGKRVAGSSQEQDARHKRARLGDPLQKAAAASFPPWDEFEPDFWKAWKSDWPRPAAEFIKAHRDALSLRLAQRTAGEPTQRYWEQQSKLRCLQRAFNKL
jgi:hypothetical protein